MSLTIILIPLLSLMVGMVAAGAVWFGWSALENISALRKKKAREAEQTANGEPEKEK